MILSSYCIPCPAPVTPITFSSPLLAVLPLCCCIQESSSAQLLIPVFLVRVNRKHTQEKGIASYCSSNTQPARAAQSRKLTVDFPPAIYLSSESSFPQRLLFKPLESMRWSGEKGKRRGGEESGPLQDVG